MAMTIGYCPNYTTPLTLQDVPGGQQIGGNAEGQNGENGNVGYFPPPQPPPPEQGQGG
jgi:hypothetical protein